MNPDWLRFNNSFCVLPFMQLHLDTSKKKRLCCESDHVIDSSTSFNSAEYTKIREDMLGNRMITGCQSCYLAESKKMMSTRQRYLRDLRAKQHEAVLYEQIDKHRQGADLEPFWYDLRISNNCNLACQICGPSSSSTIAKSLGLDSHHLSFEIDVAINSQSNYVYLAGGEPFLIKKFASLLAMIENTECEIVINTNGTVITDAITQQLSRFKNVCITISLDGVGKLNEKLRKNSSWVDIDNNIDRFKSLGYNIHAQTAVQKENINALPELAKYICSKGIEVWTLMEVIDPDKFNWRHADMISKSSLEKLLQMPIIKKNLHSVMLLKQVISHV